MIRLFIIENHETIIVSGIKHLFRPQRDQVIVIGSAASVSGALESHDISACDVIMLDLWIPNEKPLDNVKRLKEKFPSKPILIYTSEDSPEWIRKMMAAGVKGYVIKEGLRETLKSAIKNLAAGGTYFFQSPEAEDAEVDGESAVTSMEQLSPVQKKIMTLLISGENQKSIAIILNTKVKLIEKELSSLRIRHSAKTNIELVKLLLEKALL